MEENGIWIRFDKPEDYLKLSNLVKNVDVAWKIKEPSHVKYYLNNGSVLVYCTKDSNGIYNIPRMHIVINKQNRINYVWGIAEFENIEPELLDILDEKLDEIKDKKFLHKKRIDDMKLLTLIQEKTENNQELSIEEIKFLYEFDREINCFGFAKDSRIANLRKTRNATDDMNRVFRTLDNYDGDLTFNFPSFADGLVFPKNIRGNFTLGKVKSLNNCKLPEFVEGDVNFPKLKKVKNVFFMGKVLGDINIESLEQADHFVFPEFVGGSIYAGKLKTTKSVVLSRILMGNAYFSSWNKSEKTIFFEQVGGEIQLTSLKENESLMLPRKYKSIYVPVNFRPSSFTKYPEEESVQIKEETEQHILKKLS